jgi:N-acetylglucosaminyldiphosphoundecaprenol N-acetyl-beta-D-mannosaminyltransferase
MLKQKAIIQDFEINLNSAEELLETAFKEAQYRIVTFNPEMLMVAQANPEFKLAIKQAAVLIPDGIGIVLLLKKIGFKSAKRQAGIEIAWKLLEKAIQKKQRIALIGSTDESLAGTIAKIQNTFGAFNLVYKHNGFFDEIADAEIINQLKQAQPDLTLMAMPFVRQEIFLSKANLQGISIGLGGSFDVWAGKVQRSPEIMQNLGLEWLWRLYKQPERFSRLAKVFWPFLKIYLSISPCSNHSDETK